MDNTRFDTRRRLSRRRCSLAFMDQDDRDFDAQKEFESLSNVMKQCGSIQSSGVPSDSFNRVGGMARRIQVKILL